MANMQRAIREQHVELCWQALDTITSIEKESAAQTEAQKLAEALQVQRPDRPGSAQDNLIMIASQQQLPIPI